MCFFLLKYIWCTTLLHCNTAYTSSSLYDNARCVLWTQFTAVYSSVEAVWWLIHFQYAMNCPFLCSVKFCWVEWDHIEHFTGITQHIKGDTERVSFQSELKMYKRKPWFASKFFDFATLHADLQNQKSLQDLFCEYCWGLTPIWLGIGLFQN